MRSNMIFGFILGAIIIGFLMPIQAGLNAELARYLKNPFLSILISLGTGAIAISLILFINGSFTDLRRITQIPPHLFLGGILGVLFVGSSLFLIPRLGATAMIGAFITGQLLGSVIIDHYGIFGFQVYPLSFSRIAGVILLFAGLLLVVKKPA